MSQEMVKQDGASQIERVLIGGDISQLKPDERVVYYKMVCDSVGLNPLTKPFEYITLNGKLTLYARKDCTDQLRKIHGISIKIVARETVNDCYVVTAQAANPHGRTDESIGATATGNLKGDALCNAIMKAETKAKRRVTLSMCGLGMLDETEIETIPARNKKELEVLDKEVVLGVESGPIRVSITEQSPKEESALERKLKESLETIGGKQVVPEDLSGIGNPYITLDDAKAIHIHARSFLDKKYQKFAKELVHDWCKARGLVDEKGEGTLMKVKKFYVRNGMPESGITGSREALEVYMKERNLEKIAEETQAV